ncbi:hypothetical protein ABK040_004549 [Willaertia magna]
MSSLIQHVGNSFPHLNYVCCYSQRGNSKFEEIFKFRLEKLSLSFRENNFLEFNEKQSIVIDDDLNFHLFCKNNLIIACQAKETTKFRVCYNFLEDLQKEFVKRENWQECEMLTILEEKMNFYNDPQNDKIYRLQKDIDVVGKLMEDNLDKLLKRIGNMQQLIVETESLADSTEQFVKKGDQLKTSMTKRWILIGIIGFLFCLLFIAMIVLLILKFVYHAI